LTLPFYFIAGVQERQLLMLATDNTIVLIVDVQGKLAHLMHDKEILFNNIRKTIKGAQVLDIPILVTEQYPEGLGSTIPEVAGLFENPDTISKTSFSCCGDDRFMQVLNDLQPENILVAGIETHVCVYQTVRDLLRANYAVQIIADAVSSRTKNNKKIGLKKIIKAGAEITSVETVLFELLREAGGEKFKNILEIVK
jgi:nicotinamidase-related amidase